MNDELKDLDLSSLSFEQFVEYFFARKVVPDNEQFDLFMIGLDGERFDENVPVSRSTVVKHMIVLFSNFGQIATKYTIEQVDQGVWGILGANLRLYELIFDSSVPLESRLACIRSMYNVYADFVSHLQSELGPDLSGFFMWWDLILHGFWNSGQPHFPGTYRGDASKLDSESRQILDVMFETLQRMLLLPDRNSQKSALHGLGHLHHPDVHGEVQQFIDTHGEGFTLKWLEQCRDGVCQ
jgi:hypothetical protein